MMSFHNAKIPISEQRIRNRRIPWSKYLETRLFLTTVVHFHSMCPIVHWEPFWTLDFGFSLIENIIKLSYLQCSYFCSALAAIIFFWISIGASS